MKLLLAISLMVTACGPVNIAAPISVQPDPGTTGEIATPTPSPEASVVEEPVVEEPEPVVLATYTCSASTFGGTHNGVPIFYVLTVYDTLEGEAVAHVDLVERERVVTNLSQNTVRVQMAGGYYWEVWIDRASLVLSAYYYNSAGTPIHWQSFQPHHCTRDGI